MVDQCIQGEGPVQINVQIKEEVNDHGKKVRKINIIDVLKPSDEALVEPTRARDEKGHYIADDPSTPDVNEAWEGGKKPSKSKSSEISSQPSLS